MDQLKGAFNSFSGGSNNQQAEKEGPIQESGSGSGSGGGGFLGGLGDKFNSAAGGGKESEKNEDYIDKGKQSRARLHNLCPFPNSSETC